MNKLKKKLSLWHLVPSLHGKQMGKQWKQWLTIFLGSKITAGGDCNYKIRRCLLLGRKEMTNLESILKRHFFSFNKSSRDITLLTKFHLVKVAGSQHGSSHPWQRSCGEAWYAKASQDSRGPPRTCLSIYPQTRICLFYYFTTFTNSSDINGGLSRSPFSEGNQLRALVN